MSEPDNELNVNVAERWKIVSILLSYPDDDLYQTLGEISQYVQEVGDEGLVRVVSALVATPPDELTSRYVQSFDFQESTALYLTSHELGDSRERGGALLELHAMLRSAGLVLPEGELPDYLPVLFEFLAEKPVGMPTDALEARLHAVCQGIAGRLEDDSPYRPLFTEVAAWLPATASASSPAPSPESPAVAGLNPGAFTRAPAENSDSMRATGFGSGNANGSAVGAARGSSAMGTAATDKGAAEAPDIDNLPYPLVYD